jgi:hypothetical protein
MFRVLLLIQIPPRGIYELTLGIKRCKSFNMTIYLVTDSSRL